MIFCSSTRALFLVFYFLVGFGIENGKANFWCNCREDFSVFSGVAFSVVFAA